MEMENDFGKRSLNARLKAKIVRDVVVEVQENSSSEMMVKLGGRGVNGARSVAIKRRCGEQPRNGDREKQGRNYIFPAFNRVGVPRVALYFCSLIVGLRRYLRRGSRQHLALSLSSFSARNYFCFLLDFFSKGGFVLRKESKKLRTGRMQNGTQLTPNRR